MNRNARLHTPIGLTLSTLGLALLTACGGGGGDVASTAPIPVAPIPVAPRPEQPSIQEAAVPAVVTICGVQPAPVAGPESHTVTGAQTEEIDGFTTRFSRVTSLAGYPYDGAPVTLSLPLEDLRDVAVLGYTPQTTLDGMGVETGSRFKPGSVGCVRGLSRVKNNGTEANPNYQFMWGSESVANVPVEAVPNFAINGFEFLNNFDTTAATAIFRMNKALINDPATLQICRISRTGSTDCQAPVVTDEDPQWVFKSPITQAGVYVLSAPARELPMD